MDEETPWDRQPGENNLWFRRFQAFLRLGPRRSLLSAYIRELDQRGLSTNKKTSAPGSWQDAYRKFTWPARAEAWDEDVARRETEEWEARRRQLREQEWESAQALIEKAKQMLVFPLAKTQRSEKDADGKIIAETIIIPARWSVRDAAAMVDTASKLMRLSSDLETDRLAVDWRSEVERAGLDPDTVSNELVEFFKAKLNKRESDAAVDGGGGPGGGETDPGAG